MIANCYYISEKPQLIPCDYRFALEQIRQQREKIWIDLNDATRDDIEPLLDELKISELIRHFCLEASDHPGFYPLNPVGLIVIPVQMEVQQANNISFLSVLLSNDFVVTIRDSRMARLKKDLSSDDSTEVLPDGTPAGLIAALMLGLSLDCLRKTSKLGELISDMEHRMEKEPYSLEIEEISERRNEIITIESIVQSQLPILTAVTSSDRPSKIEESTRDYLRWATANLESADKKLEWMENRIKLIRSTLDMYAQDKMNNRLGRLTVLSMIFMPITFLAGVWGMNFNNMPLLNYEYGYIVAVAGMVMIASGMYYYFKRKSWFD